ncbi:D-amino peptidase [Clostridiales Family XIII bacterium PM5-7]
MKIFISADLEGVNGVVAPEDVVEAGAGYQQARTWMTEEVNAVVEGAFLGGATEIVVCDAHNVAANIRMDCLDPRAQLMRGSTRRNSMVHGLDETFDGVIFLGYHAKFGTVNAIMDHSFSPELIHDIRINGLSVGELGVNGYYAASKNVPLIMATGDQGLDTEARAFYPEIETAVVKHAEGRFCARCLPRAQTQTMLRETAERAVASAKTKKPVIVPKELTLEVTFRQVNLADGAMRVSGARRIDALTVAIDSPNMEDLMGTRQVLFEAAQEFYHPFF